MTEEMIWDPRLLPSESIFISFAESFVESCILLTRGGFLVSCWRRNFVHPQFSLTWHPGSLGWPKFEIDQLKRGVLSFILSISEQNEV